MVATTLTSNIACKSVDQQEALKTAKNADKTNTQKVITKAALAITPREK